MPLTRRSRAAAFAASISITIVFCMTGTALAFDGPDCSDFTYQEDAQAALAADPARSHRLDVSADGVACESLPNRSPGTNAPVTGTTPVTSPMTTPQVVPQTPRT